MINYITIIATTLFLAWMITDTYAGSINSLATRTKNRLCYLLIFLILSFYVGLRTDYNDTYSYIQGYLVAEPVAQLPEAFSFGDHPGFFLTRSWLKSLGVSVHGFLLFFSLIFVGSSLFFFWKYSPSFALSLFLYYATNSYTFSAAAVKQNAAISLALLAIMFALKNKWLIFALLLAVASTFHTYVLMFALVPLLFFKPWSAPTYIMLAVFVSAGFMLDSLLGTIIDITTLMGDTYEEERLIGEGINVFRVLVSNVPTALAFVYRKTLWQNCSKAECLIINLAMLNGAIMFVGQFGKAIYFSRLASYFTIMQCVALPIIISKLPRNRKKLLTSAMVLGYVGFFLYGNQAFNEGFKRITLTDYLTNYVFK